MASKRPAYFFLLIASLLNVAMVLGVANLQTQHFRLRCQRNIRSPRRNEISLNAVSHSSDLKPAVAPLFRPENVKPVRDFFSPLLLLANSLFLRETIWIPAMLTTIRHYEVSHFLLQRYRLSADHPPEYVQ